MRATRHPPRGQGLCLEWRCSPGDTEIAREGVQENDRLRDREKERNKEQETKKDSEITNRMRKSEREKENERRGENVIEKRILSSYKISAWTQPFAQAQRCRHARTTGPLTPAQREKLTSHEFESLLQQSRICHLSFLFFFVGDPAQTSTYCLLAVLHETSLSQARSTPIQIFRCFFEGS